MNWKFFGVIGNLLLIVGVFMPIVNVPIMGGMNYVQQGQGDGIVIAALAATALIMLAFNRGWFCYVSAFGSASIMVFTFIRFQTMLSQLKQDMNVELEGNPFRGIADAAMGSVSLGYGWAILAVGVILAATAAINRESNMVVAKGHYQVKGGQKCR